MGLYVPRVEMRALTSTSEPVHEDKNLARYLVDYLLRQGYVKTAKAVTESASVEVSLASILYSTSHLNTRANGTPSNSST